MVIPDWIDQETWEYYLEVRKRRKAANTERAFKIIFKKLRKFREQGFDVNEILEESCINEWKGVFPPKNTSRTNNTRIPDDWVNKAPNDGGYQEEQMRFEGFARTDDGSFGESETSH